MTQLAHNRISDASSFLFLLYLSPPRCVIFPVFPWLHIPSHFPLDSRCRHSPSVSTALRTFRLMWFLPSRSTRAKAFSRRILSLRNVLSRVSPRTHLTTCSACVSSGQHLERGRCVALAFAGTQTERRCAPVGLQHYQMIGWIAQVLNTGDQSAKGEGSMDVDMASSGQVR